MTAGFEIAPAARGLLLDATGDISMPRSALPIRHSRRRVPSDVVR